MRKKFNGRLVVSAFATVVLLGAGVHFLHAYQVRRNAGAFLRLVEVAESEKRLGEAANYMSRYLHFEPQDAKAWAKFGLLLAEQSPRSFNARVQTFLALERALHLDPERDDVRRKTASMAMQIDRFADAKFHLDFLLKRHPDAELAFLRGRCEEIAGHHQDADTWYAEAIAADKAGKTGGRDQVPDYVIGSYVSHAKLCQRHLKDTDGKYREKETVDALSELVERYPNCFESYLARAVYYWKFGVPGQKTEAEARRCAAEDLDRAIEIAPDSERPQLLVIAADLAQANHNLEKAREHLVKALQLSPPKNAGIYQAFARMELRAAQRQKTAEARAEHRQKAVDYLRQSLKLMPNQPEALWTMADVLIDVGELDEAAKVLDRLRGNARDELIQYLRARILVQREEWFQAGQTLEAVRPLLGRASELTMQADLLLGRCYEQLGNPELEQAAYRHALQIDPFWVPARQRLAGSLAGMERIEEALEEYRQVATQSAEARRLLAQLTVGRHLRAGAPKESFLEISRILADLEKHTAPEDRGAIEMPILRAEVLVGQGLFDQSRKVLEEALDKVRAAKESKPEDELLLRIALASVVEREGRANRALQKTKAEEAWQILQSAGKDLGDSVELRLAKASYWRDQRTDEAAKLLPQLEKDQDKLDGDKTRLLRGLAQIYSWLGELKEARRLWGQVAAQRPNELRVQLILYDLAYRDEDETALPKVLTEMKRIEGEGPLWHYGEASRLILRVRKSGKADVEPKSVRAELNQARKHLAEVSRPRPAWSRMLLRLAEADDLEGNAEAAIRNYQLAIERKERPASAVFRLAQLLYERRRYRDANDAIRKLEEQRAVPATMVLLAADVSLNAHEEDRASSLAARVQPHTLRDYRDHIWLGQIYGTLAVGEKNTKTRQDHLAKAEKSLTQAVTLEPKRPEPRVALVVFFARTGQKEKAEEALRKTEATLAAEDASLVLGPCYEALGQREKAEREYERAQARQPADRGVLYAVSDYYLRHGLFAKAEPLLRRLLEQTAAAPDERRWARRSLAVGLAADAAVNGNYRQLQRALDLLELNAEGGTPATEEQRAKAVVLAMWPGHRREAIRLFEELRPRQPLSPDEQYILGRLYEAERDWPRAREVIRSALTSPDAERSPRYSTYLAAYVRSLVGRSEVAEAQLWLDRLEKREPTGFRTLDGKARVLKAQGREANAVVLITTYASNSETDLREAAGLLEELGPAAEAEKLYRLYVAKSKRPESALALAHFLSRHQGLAEALDLCDRAWLRCRAEAVALTSVAVVRLGQADAEQCQRVKRRLDEALKKEAKPVVLTALADLCDFQKQYAEAESLYRRVLQQAPDNVEALNNLAWLLAFKRSEEALALVNRAISVHGPVGEILDTRAVVYLELGQTDKALKDLQEAIAQGLTAGRYLHLARVHHQAGKRAEAREALRQAIALEPEARGLHPLERPSYDALRRDLKQ